MDLVASSRRNLLGRAFVAALAAAIILAALPAAASATTVYVTRTSCESCPHDLVMNGEGDESEEITVRGARGRLRVGDARNDIEYTGPDPDRDFKCCGPTCSAESSRELNCGIPHGVIIRTRDDDDEITVDLDTVPERTSLDIDPGPDRDRLHLRAGSGRDVRVNLRDGSVDRLSCSDETAVRVDRDAEDQIDGGCRLQSGEAPAPPAADTVPPRVDLTARRAQRRASVLRSGLRTVCATTEPGTCSVTASLSRRAARSVGIRARAPRYLIGRASAAVPAPGARRIQVKLSRRARSALRGRRITRLRVLLTATMVDRAGNRARRPFTVTIRR